jgi:[acyl-carrier-protein] S-malonyltransferase
MTVAAWVAGTPIEVSDVDGRETALRSGPVAPTLPRERTGEGRQLRRWLVQVLVAEQLVTGEAATRGLTPEDAPPLTTIAPDRAAMLGLGSVAADLLTRNPLARAVFAAVTAEVRVPQEAVSRFHEDNPFEVPEERVVRHSVNNAPPQRRVLRRGELTGPVENAVFAASPGETVGPIRDPLGTHTLAVEEVHPARTQPLAEVHASITEFLLAPARRRAFTTWLDHHMATEVRLAPGYEHPGDPNQPDNTHRH